MATERKYRDQVLGEVTLRKSPQAGRISIRVIPVKGIVVTIPRWVPYRMGEAFLAGKRGWAAAALERVDARVRESLAAEGMLRDHGTSVRGLPETSGSVGTETDGGIDIGRQIEIWRKEAKATLPPRLAELAGKYGFEPSRVTIKHNRSNWGSCSARGNINLNLNLIRLPKDLQDYVMLHELCHLRYMDHGTLFHGLLEDLCRQEGLGSSQETGDRTTGETEGRTTRETGGIEGSGSGHGQVHEKLRKQLKGYLLL